MRKVSEYPETQELLSKILETAVSAIRAGMLREEVLPALHRAAKEADAEFDASQN